MPWVKALLRGQTVFARADASGGFVVESGLVEVRYKPDDGRFYRARDAGLTSLGGVILPDDACAPAEAAPKRPAEGAPAPAAASPRGAAGAPRKSAPARSAGTSSTSSAATTSSATATPALVARAAKSAVFPIVAYTDGGCSGNPGPAGLGVLYQDPDRIVELSEYLGVGTNNIAELTAVQRAVELSAGKPGPILIYTDSQYSIGVLTKGWKAKANTELILNLRKLIAARGDVSIEYVPGHKGVTGNEAADELATRAISARRTSKVERAREKPSA